MSKVKIIDKKLRKRKFKAHADLSYFARDWDGTGPKVKIRLPYSGSREKKEILIAPGEVVSIRDRRAQRALENWAPPPIYVDGKVWFVRERLFKATVDMEHVNFDEGSGGR